MTTVLCLVITCIPAMYAGSVSSWHRFDRQVALHSVKAREHPFSAPTAPNHETCASLCAKDELCAAITFLEGKCSMYRSSLTSSGKTALGARHFIKTDALPDPDPCPASKGYTSVLSPRLCYKYIPGWNNWNSHNALCQADGGRLIVLNSQEKQEYMASFQSQADVSDNFWIGMQKVNGVFTWQGDSTFAWKWYNNAQSGSSNAICVQLYKALPDPDPCPASKGYTSVLSPRLCYKYMSKWNRRNSHNALCQADGGRLIVLNSQEKQEYMASFQSQDDVSIFFWIGMQRVNDVYTWLDNSTYVWKWYQNEPDRLGNMDCVLFYKGEVKDIFCTCVRAAVC